MEEQNNYSEKKWLNKLEILQNIFLIILEEEQQEATFHLSFGECLLALFEIHSFGIRRNSNYSVVRNRNLF